MTDYIIWKDEYSVSNNAIDLQHQRIINIINGVFTLVKSKISGARISNSLANLKKYTETHFEYEEKMMQMVGYPDIKQHEALHKTMAEKTSAICKVQQRSANGIMPDDLLDFLKDWWFNHIRSIDMQYAPFVSKPK